MTLQFNVALTVQSTWVIYVFCLSSDMFSTGICTTRQWQTSGLLLQELSVCSVARLGYAQRVGGPEDLYWTKNKQNV